MKDDTPRGPDGSPLCAWCGGEIKQSGVGRAKVYCKRTCREMAYRDRRLNRLIAEAVEAAGSNSSTDVSGNRQLSNPGRRRPSVDETGAAPPRGVTPGGKRPLLPPPPGRRPRA